MKNLILFFFIPILILSLASCDGLTELATQDAVDKCGEISEDEIWTESGSSIDIHVTCDLIITGNVTLDEGISVLVEDDVAIIVRGTGSFKAVGRSGDEIKIFGTGSDNEPTWKGLFINSDSRDNDLSHLEVKGAGSEVIEIGNKRNDAAAIEVLGSASIDNCLVTSSNEVGILINVSDEVTSQVTFFRNNTIENCKEHPIMIESSLLGPIGESIGTSTFNNNTENSIRLFNSSSSLVGSHEWHPAQVPYYIREEIRIDGGLELHAGVELIMHRNAEIYISSNNSSYFKTNGTSSDRVRIVGEDPGLSSWVGIWFNSNNSNNQLNHTTLIGGAVPSGTDTRPAVFVSGLSSPGASLSINELTIDQSECGMRFGPWANVTGVASVTSSTGVTILCD